MGEPWPSLLIHACLILCPAHAPVSICVKGPLLVLQMLALSVLGSVAVPCLELVSEQTRLCPSSLQAYLGIASSLSGLPTRGLLPFVFIQAVFTL